jgi:hypothetical protein
MIAAAINADPRWADCPGRDTLGPRPRGLLVPKLEYLGRCTSPYGVPCGIYKCRTQSDRSIY